MARQTFQGRLRTMNGRSMSNIDNRTKLLYPILAQNLAGPIQIVVTNPPNATKIIGMLPAFWLLQTGAILTAAGAGTFALAMPAYRGLPAVSLYAPASVATVAGVLALTAGGYASYAQDRPVELTTTGVTGTFRIGLFGVALDDGAGSLI